ncbi:MAG TPA: transcriptional repressor LexA, partial [Pyrinomonadaceae bacterium]|nr:transcriptional repressor LexA [Pyrinomonadaceae bacterium]
MLPRTQRQKDILDYITRFSERNRYEPSYAQIARHFGVKSRATIAKHIAALERRGLLTRTHEDGSFALSVKVDDPDALCQVKLLGRIAAGAPLDVVESAEMLSVPRFLLGRVKPDRVYALRVKGDSMIDEHICDGDIALIENRTEARDGEIVVALLVEENQATLKKLYR